MIRRVHHAGLEFELDDLGPSGGDPVVLLHGFPQRRWCWDAVASTLAAAGCRTVAPDQRGYSPGARPAGVAAYTVEHLAADVLAIADDAGFGRFHLVGHDWGGLLGWHLATDRPERLLSLTVLSTPHPSAYRASLLRSDQAMRSWYIGAVQVPQLPERLLATTTGASMLRRALVRSGLDDVDAGGYVDSLVERGARGPLHWYRALRRRRPRSDRPVAVPTTYVYGSGDVALTRRAADRTGEHVVADYRYEVVDAGHWLPERSAALVADLVLARIRDPRS